MALFIWWREGEGVMVLGGWEKGKDVVQVDTKPSKRLADLKLYHQFQDNFTPDQINSG